MSSACAYPTSVLFIGANKATKKMDAKSLLNGYTFSEDAEILIMNYDIIKNFHDPKDKTNSKIFNSNIDLVIIDEAHYIQNKTAQRTKLINDFVKGVDRLWLLTGTPMTSRPMNYFNLLELIESPVAANWMAYVIRYCNGYQFTVGNRKVWNVMGASNLEELRDRTSRQVLRRLKTDVLDLPDKIITPVYLRLKSKEYEELMGEYFQWYDTKSWYLPEDMGTGVDGTGEPGISGRDVSNTSQTMLHITAAITYQIFGGNSTLYDFTILFPAVIGSLTVIVIFGLVRLFAGTTAGLFASLLFAVSLPIILRGTIGWFKSEPLGIFYGLLGLYLFLSAIQSENKKIAFLKIISGGIVLALSMASWGGTQFLIIPIGIFVLALPFVKKDYYHYI